MVDATTKWQISLSLILLGLTSMAVGILVLLNLSFGECLMVQHHARIAHAWFAKLYQLGSSVDDPGFDLLFLTCRVEASHGYPTFEVI
jgi:hypothetical protein